MMTPSAAEAAAAADADVDVAESKNANAKRVTKQAQPQTFESEGHRASIALLTIESVTTLVRSVPPHP